MISAVTHALKTRRELGDSGSAMNVVTKLAREQRDEQAKIGMIAAASKALEIAERNPDMTDRKIINQVMSDLPGILSTVREHS
jgi:hypothetical protein